MLSGKRIFSSKYSLYWLMAPLFIYLAAFYLYPLIYSIYIGFFEWSMGDPTKTFVGLQNYVDAFHDSQFVGSFLNTGIFVVAAVGIELALGLALAMLLNRETWTMRILRTVVLLPTLLTPLVVALTWKALLNPDFGALTYYIRALGIDIGRGVFVERGLAMAGIVLIDVWQWTSLITIILLAGLKGMPVEPYEAAYVDGASRWQAFRCITIPLLRPTILVALVVRSLDAMKIFDSVFAITGGGPGTVTTTMNFHIYKVGIDHLRVGYASALSNIFLVISVVIGLLIVRSVFLSSRRKGGAV